ncbi:MAG TPA: aminotransferase class V-fold PLP-dependent enzyme [Streptosporangiaceae bacterium]|nr:aminotransferase class V-fold PLP-dependent enzyme [Streptosporangiaceae bacterium]
MGGTDTNWWQELRAEFPYLEDHVFAWSGGQVPIANSVRAAIGRVMASWDDDPITLATTEWPVFDGARQEVATLFDCSPDRVAVTESTSGAMYVATAMVLARWQRSGAPPANVVLHWDCHPASSYQWLVAAALHEPLTVRWAVPGDHPDPVEALLARADDETIAVVATHVAWRSGAALDLAALGRRRAAARWALLIDAAQSAGAVPIGPHADHIDFIGFPGYKWLLGPPGTGYLVTGTGWVGEPSPVSGWAVAKDFPVDVTEFKPMPGGAGIRFGMPSFIPLAGSQAALKLLNRAGIDRIAARVADLTGLLLAGLDDLGFDPVTPRAAHERAGVCSVEVGDLDQAVAALAEHRIATFPELQYIRLDLHAFNNEQDVERILACFATLRRP